MKHIFYMTMMMVLGVLFFSGNKSYAQNNQTPMMGWSSWNTFKININETLIKETADAMVSKGLKNAGYTYVNIDDGFFYGRNVKGKLQYNSAKFPNGMKPVADYIHDKGLKAGIYSDGGVHTCAYQWDSDTYGQFAGMKGHEEEDAKLYFDGWGYDFIKLDYCGGLTLGLDEETQYRAIWNAIQNTEKVKTGGNVRFNICRWMFPGTWASEIAGSWRISHDITNEFDTDRGVRGILEKNLYLAAYASPAHFNDMDMMQIGRGTFTAEQEKSHFGLWCIMSSPLLIGCDLRSIPQSTIDIITNTEVIAVNQDVLGLQARLISRDGKQFVLAKPIEADQGAIRAVALFNCENSAKTMRINFADIQLEGQVTVRNLWAKQDVGQFEEYYEVSVPAYGTAMLRLEGESSFDKTTFEGEYAFIKEYNEVKIDKGTYTGARFSYKFGASGNYIMSNLGNRAGNWAEFRDVYSSTGGTYKFKLFYYSDSDKTLTVTVNGTNYEMTGLNSGGTTKRGRAFIDEIELQQGYNTIRLSNATGAAPEIDKFVLLDPNDPGDDDESDYIIDEEIIENINFPIISSEDNSNETWYYIQFRNLNGVLQSMGEGSNIQTAQKLLNMNDQLWKIVPTATNGNYMIVNKNGNKMAFANSRFTTDVNGVEVNIVATTNATYTPAWEIKRSTASSCMNQWSGAGFEKELGEWTKGDGNNSLLFVAEENELNYMPEISTDDKEVWYYMYFKKGGNVLQDMGAGADLTIQVATEDNSNQLWKVTGTKDNYAITSKTGRTIGFSSSFYKATTETENPLKFKFVFAENEDWVPAWELQRPGGSQYLNQYQNTNVGQRISEWNRGDGGNMLNFRRPSEMGFNEPIEGFPVISDNTTEKWYYIQFQNGKGVIQDMGDNAPILTKGITTDDAQHWKVIKTSNTEPHIYQIVSKDGRRITHVSSAETADGLYQATSTLTSATNFDIVESTNSTYAPALELHREGSSRHMNQYKGAGIDRMISEWNKGDQGNPLRFVAIEDAEIVRAEMPEISSADNSDETWYYISFFDVVEEQTAYLQDMGDGTALMTKEKDGGNPDQTWKIILSATPSGNYMYNFVSKSGNFITWDGSVSRYTTSSTGGINIRFNELAPYWVLEREGGENGQGMTQVAKGPEQQLNDGWNSEAYGRLSFVAAGNVSTPNINAQRCALQIENKQLIIEGNNISKVTVYQLTGQTLFSQTKSFAFSFANPGCYIVSITYSDGFVENKKVIVN